jgi:hypothetical protein
MYATRAAIKINEKIHEQCKSLYEKLPLSRRTVSLKIIVDGNIRPLFFLKGDTCSSSKKIQMRYTCQYLVTIVHCACFEVQVLVTII